MKLDFFCGTPCEKIVRIPIVNLGIINSPSSVLASVSEYSSCLSSPETIKKYYVL